MSDCSQQVILVNHGALLANYLYSICDFSYFTHRHLLSCLGAEYQLFGVCYFVGCSPFLAIHSCGPLPALTTAALYRHTRALSVWVSESCGSGGWTGQAILQRTLGPDVTEEVIALIQSVTGVVLLGLDMLIARLLELRQRNEKKLAEGSIKCR